MGTRRMTTARVRSLDAAARQGLAPAREAAVRRRRRPGLWAAGAALLAVGAFGAAVLVGRAGDRVPVLAVARTVYVGEAISDGDVRVARVAADPALQPIPAGWRCCCCRRAGGEPGGGGGGGGREGGAGRYDNIAGTGPGVAGAGAGGRCGPGRRRCGAWLAFRAGGPGRRAGDVRGGVTSPANLGAGRAGRGAGRTSGGGAGAAAAAGAARVGACRAGRRAGQPGVGSALSCAVPGRTGRLRSAE